MPAFRNVANRHSGRLSKSTPVIYGEDGWQDFDATVSSCLDVKSEPIKVELIDQPLSPLSPSTLSSSPSSSPAFSEVSSSVEFRDTSASASASPPPSRKNSNSHSRRRDPTHIPRPRNAFILFRSDYIKGETAKGLAEGQQNELSKLAAKVWNKMSSDDRQPYSDRAKLEKEEHYRKYPNYVYAPGRNGSNVKARPTKRKSGAVGRGHARKRKASIVSDEEDSSMPGSPDMSPIMLPVRSQKTPRMAAQRAALKITQPPSPSPSPSASIQHSPMSDAFPLEDKDEDVAASSSPQPFFSGGDSDYVPTSEIPELELTPKEEYSLPPEGMDYLPYFPVHPYSSFLDHIPNRYGLRRNFPDPTLPPLPQGMVMDDEFSEFLNLQPQERQTVDDIFGYLSNTATGTSTFHKDNNTSAPTSSTTTTTATTTSLPASVVPTPSYSSSLPDIDPMFKCHSEPPELFPDLAYPFLQPDENAGIYQFFDFEGNHLC